MAAAMGCLAAPRLRAAAAFSRLVVRGVAGPPGPTLGPGPGDCEHDPDSDWEPERELRDLERTLKQQKKEIRFQKIRRLMEDSGAPPRVLTRKAMEQIRYLHKEFSEDWSVPRLAEGFGVRTDVIKRVLKSKFIPTLKQEIKQDQKILGKTRLIHRPQQEPASLAQLVSGSLPRSEYVALPQTCNEVRNYNLAFQEKKKNLQTWKSPRSQKVRDKISQLLGRERHIPLVTAQGDHREKQRISSSQSKQEKPQGSHTDGLLNEKEEEVVKEPKTGGKEFSSKVFQRGREFFDSNGNFLYRI